MYLNGISKRQVPLYFISVHNPFRNTECNAKMCWVWVPNFKAWSKKSKPNRISKMSNIDNVLKRDTRSLMWVMNKTFTVYKRYRAYCIFKYGNRIFPKMCWHFIFIQIWWNIVFKSSIFFFSVLQIEENCCIHNCSRRITIHLKIFSLYRFPLSLICFLYF